VRLARKKTPAASTIVKASFTLISRKASCLRWSSPSSIVRPAASEPS
jgi:hypothetical protein